jgi:hypothetical protein
MSSGRATRAETGRMSVELTERGAGPAVLDGPRTRPLRAIRVLAPSLATVREGADLTEEPTLGAPPRETSTGTVFAAVSAALENDDGSPLWRVQNLVSHRTPGKTAISVALEGLTICRSAPRTSHGVSATL